MDVRIDELSKVRIYSSSDKELCEAMEEESKVFVESKILNNKGSSYTRRCTSKSSY
jgi:hypothetical protein